MITSPSALPKATNFGGCASPTGWEAKRQRFHPGCAPALQPPGLRPNARLAPGAAAGKATAVSTVATNMAAGVRLDAGMNHRVFGRGDGVHDHGCSAARRAAAGREEDNQRLNCRIGPLRKAASRLRDERRKVLTISEGVL